MLEGVTIIGDVIIVVIRVGEEGVACCEDITRRKVGCRQLRLLGILDDEEALVVVRQILTELIAQIGVGVSIAYNLDGAGTTDTAMIRGDNDGMACLRQQLEEVGDDRVAEPRECDTPVGTFIVREFSDHL